MKINGGFVLICSLAICAPLARGSVHLWAITITQMAALAGLFILLVCRISAGKPLFRKNALDVPLAAMAFFVLATALISDYPSLAAEGVITFFSYVAIYFIAVNSINTRKEQRILVYIIVGMAMFISMIAVLKGLSLNPFPFWQYSDLSYKANFLAGTYGNHNHFAGLLEMAIPLMLCLLFTRKRSVEKNSSMLAIVLILTTILTFTFSRGGWISTLSALLFMAAVLLKKKFYGEKYFIRTLFSVIVVLTLVLISTPVFQRMVPLIQENRGDHIYFRLKVWESGVALIKDNPFSGTGPGTFAQAFPFYSPTGFDVLPVYAHNDYLQFTADTGLFFIPLALWLLFVFFSTGFTKLKSKSRQTRGITLGAMTSIFAILVHSVFDFNLHIPANALLFTILAALVCSEPPHLQNSDSPVLKRQGDRLE